MMNREQKIKKLLLRDEIEKRKCEQSYYEFVKKAFAILEPQTKFLDNWHIKYLCDEIQEEIERIARNEIKTKDINCNIPPRSLKSYIFSIMLCPWAWTRFPHLKFINSSHSKELSTEHCVEGRRLIDSDWYQKHWGGVFQLSSDQNVKSHYKNTMGGKRFSTSVKGKVTGHGADVIVTDDLMDPESADSDADRKRAIDHYMKTLFTRLNDQQVGLRINVQQRLHEEDISGVIAKHHAAKYHSIVIPAELDIEVIHPKGLQKHYVDGLFFPARFNRLFLEEAKAMGDLNYYTQFGQRPSKPGGSIFKRDDFRYYRLLPAVIDGWYMSIDATFDGKDEQKKNEPDFVVIQVWAKHGANVYWVDQIRKQMDILQTVEAIKMLCIKWPKVRQKFIEKKANGAAIITMLKGQIPGLIPFEPDKFGSKIARARAVSYVVTSGNVYVPHPDLNSEVIKFLDECTMFPNVKKDDQVDAFVQFLLNIFESYKDRLRKLLGKKQEKRK